MTDYIKEAQVLSEYTRGLRRDFHRHPELGFREVRTAGIVAQELNKLGLEVKTGIAETGVVALLEGSRSGPVRTVRFDMDALPIQEENKVEYASQVPGVMHACGHDGHTAVGLTVARLLHDHVEELSGTVKFIFQPAEEGLGGAERMIAEGILDNPATEQIYGLHVWNEKPVGWLGISPGPVMAAGEIFDVQITGRGGHGALPHQTVDPVLASAQVISALQSVVSRNISPLSSAVISVTSLHAGEAFNVVPPSAHLKGTIRTFESQERALVMERFEALVQGVGEAMGCKVDIKITPLTPAVVNHPAIAMHVQLVAADVLPDFEVDSNYRSMVSEDMAYLMSNTPGCFFFIGSANPQKGLAVAHHHPCFDIDETVLPYAAGLMASVIARDV